MRNWKKPLSLVLALVLVFSLATVSGAAEQLPTKVPKNAIVILHTNDVHGGIDGYAKIAALKKAYQDAGAYVLLVDAGDFAQGGATVNMSKGATAIELMNKTGYDAAALGNHEFDYGFSSLPALFSKAQFPVLSANVFYENKLAFGDQITFTTPGGVKIGVFGLNTPQAKTKSKPTNTTGVDILSGDKLFACAQEQVDALKAEGCEVIICLSHLGTGTDAVGNRSIDMLEKVTGIDVLIDGHSHSSLEEVRKIMGGADRVGNTVVTSTGTGLANIGVVTIADGKVSATAIPTSEISVSDKEVAALAATVNAEVDAVYGKVIGSSEIELSAKGKGTQEAPLGNLITDAMVWKSREMGIQVDGAVMNAGGIRIAIPKGEVSKKTINDVLSLCWTMTTVKVTGAQLLEALESGTFSTPENAGGFPQVSGIAYTINVGEAYDQAELYPGGSTFYRPASIRRVTIQSVDGKPFDINATYTLASNSHLAAGGATFYVFTQAAFNEDTGVLLDDLVVDYVTDKLSGKITAADYGKTQGRITIVDEPSTAFSDVSKSDKYYDAVEYVSSHGLMNGVGAKRFAPGLPLTRSTFSQILYNAAGKPAVTAAASFADVESGKWYTSAVSWAAENKLVSGAENGKFGLDDQVTREELVAALRGYAQYKKLDMTAVNGLDLSSLPGGIVTRADAAVAFSAFCKIGG